MQSPARAIPQPASATWSPAPQVTLHLLDQEGVLYDAPRRRAYALNTAATLIWCLLEEGLAEDAMARELATRANIPLPEAVQRIGAMRREWQALGLLAGSPGASSPLTSLTLPSRGASLPVPANGTEFVLRGRVLDTAIRVHLPSAHWQARLQPFLRPFSAAVPFGDEIVLSLVADESGLAWHGPDGAVSACIAPNRVAPYFKMLLVEHVLRRSGDFGALHAAALGRAGRCILLPGNAGSGKSTLAAGLMAAGFEFLGDDTVVLDRATLALRPIAYPICTKPGAWDVLVPRFPALKEEAVHVRADRKRVRYLHATRAAAPDARYDVAAIVFPRWAAGAPLALTQIARPQALQRLLAGFCPLGPDLAAADVARLVAWIAARQCYELHYAALDDVIPALQALLP